MVVMKNEYSTDDCLVTLEVTEGYYFCQYSNENRHWVSTDVMIYNSVKDAFLKVYNKTVSCEHGYESSLLFPDEVADMIEDAQAQYLKARKLVA